MKRSGMAAVNSEAEPGTVVTLQVDYSTHLHAQGLIVFLLVIVYNVKQTGSILVCCDHGVITHCSRTKADYCWYWVSVNKYSIVARKDEGILGNPTPS